jgi:4-hydroxy-2-oxoheptanedioate aldolase
LKPNSFRELLKAGKPTLGTHMNTMSPAILEILGHTGMFDYVEFVAEYATFDLHDLDHYGRTSELYNLPAIIKIDQQPRTWLAQRAVGSGFQGVLFADVRTKEDAEECVRICRPETPEDGGIFGNQARRFTYPGYGGTPQYVEHLRNLIVMLMVEKRELVDNLESVLEVPGIDMLQWGGVDYSMSIGKPGQAGSPEVKAIEKKYIETAIKMGVPPRAEIGSPEQAQYYLDLGVRHFCIGWDLSILGGWWKTNGEKMRQILETA